MIRVGDMRYEQPVCFGDGTVYKGKVIYMHPTGRWYTVQFEVEPLVHRMVSYGGRGSRMETHKGKTVVLRESFFTAQKPQPALPREGTHRRRVFNPDVNAWE